MTERKAWYKYEPHGAFWEKGYRDKQVSCMGGPSFEVIQMAAALPKNAAVLDLGCGEGRNSLFLASKGFKVTAADRSEAGIGKLRHLADELSLPLKALVVDIRDFKFSEEYDLVMAHGVLYYLKNPEWRRLLRKVKEHTRPGGYDIFTLFMYDAKYPCTPEISAAGYSGSFSPYELRSFYRDWQEFRYDKYVKWDAHPGVHLHYHPIEKLVSRKPGGAPLSFKTRPVVCRASMSGAAFRQIPIGASKAELTGLVGTTDQIEVFSARGGQYGPSNAANKLALVDGFVLELWHYKKHVVYIVNGHVEGRALYATRPMKLSITSR